MNMRRLLVAMVFVFAIVFGGLWLGAQEREVPERPAAGTLQKTFFGAFDPVDIDAPAKFDRVVNAWAAGEGVTVVARHVQVVQSYGNHSARLVLVIEYRQ